MKTLRTLYMGIAAAVLCSCIQEVQPEGQHVSGMWAIVNEQSQTTSYLKFEDGYMTTFSVINPSDLKTVADGRMWHASENDFKPISTQRYSLSAENQLFLDGKHSGEMVLDGDSMSYGKQKAMAVTEFSSDWYSSITTSVTDNQIKVDILSHELVFDYSVTNPIPNSFVHAIVSPGNMATVTLSKEGKMTIALPEVNTASVSHLTLIYPGAKDFVISLVREASTSISVTKTAWEYDYTGQSVTIPFTVSNLLSGESVKAVLGSEGSSWIKYITVGSSELNFRLEENNDSSSSQREASITLSTKGALDVKLQITQHYAAPSFTYSPSSLSTDYTAKSLSFTYAISNPRQGATASASTTDAWITDVQLNGSTVSYKVAENNSGASRTGKIKLTYGTASKEFLVIQSPDPYNGHEYVDLGLSVKWATCNVGASKPEDYGGYYQWAGTKDVKSTSINLGWFNCPYHTGSSSSTGWTKYVHSGESSYWSGTGSPDNKTVLDPSDDVASVTWKGTWRMPTDAEWTELRNTDNCSWTWTSINGINGYKVQSKKSGYTDNWIFLPAAGYRSDVYLSFVGSYGIYWSSSLYTDYPSNAYYVYFKASNVSRDYYGRYSGQSVRAVSK